MMEFKNDTEAERRVLSSMLQSEKACTNACSELNIHDFYNPKNGTIFQLISSLYEREIRPTYIELLKEGNSLGIFTNSRDMEEIKYIAEHFIDDANIKYWTGKVRQASKARQMQRLVKQYTEELSTSNNDKIPDIIRNAGFDFMALSLDKDSEHIESAKEVADLGEKLINENVQKWREHQDIYKLTGKVPLEGVPTGLVKLDRLTLGYKPGELIILGAQTGHGKTAFALNTAMAVCVQSKKPLLYINTEMNRRQIAARWGAMLSGVPLQRIRVGNLTDAELNHGKAAFRAFSTSGFYTANVPNLSPEKLHTLAHQAKLQNKIEMLILDYVGRMDKYDRNLQEWQVLEQIIKTQKILAQNLDIACMVLVQLNEDGSLQGAKRMKNESDLMLKLIPVEKDQVERIREAHKKDYEEFNYRLFIDKSRDSIAGIDIPLVFDKSRQIIREAQIK